MTSLESKQPLPNSDAPDQAEALGRPAEQIARFEAVAFVSDGLYRRLSISGPDAADYLHRRLSNSIANLQPGQGRRALQLAGDGRLEADLLVYRTGEEEFDVLTPAEHAESVAELINKFVIMEDVRVSADHANERTMILAGPHAHEALGESRIEREADAFGFATIKIGALSTRVYSDGRWGVPFLHVACANKDYGSVAEALAGRAQSLGGGPAGIDAFDLFRIRRGVSLFGRETTRETLPLDAGLYEAIDFDKGCFPGQEVLAHINNLGHPARRWARFEIEGKHSLQIPAEVFADDPAHSIGTLASIARDPISGRTIGLGFLKWKHRDQTLGKIHLDGQRIDIRIEPLGEVRDASANKPRI